MQFVSCQGPLGKGMWEEDSKSEEVKSEVNVIVVKGLDNDNVAFITCGAKSNFENTLYVNGWAT
jgi:hypothetical protein